MLYIVGVMKQNNIHVGDTVYLFQSDPKCNTIYEVQKVTKTGKVKLYHPIVGGVSTCLSSIKPSIY